jgi:Low-density lipoprotein receptor domain class A
VRETANDCNDGLYFMHADAEVPTGQCKLEEFACSSGECIDIAQRCDHKYQCDDGSDEFECCV